MPKISLKTSFILAISNVAIVLVFSRGITGVDKLGVLERYYKNRIDEWKTND